MELYVSLPRNDVELARAAADAGADALKVHMNVHHTASGTRFGSYAEEHERIREIIAAVDCPVGLMPGADPAVLPEAAELESLAEAGLSFVNIYSHHMPLWFLDLPLRRIVALGSFDGFVETAYYASRFHYPKGSPNRVSMVEASIAPHEDYGKPFTFADYRQLRILQEYVDVPLAVPTQKHITPDDARWLKRTGTAALIIGAIVAGSTAESLARATATYKAAITGED
jgi:hypothetical protein